jgi:glutaminyl-tRNA synthetase
MGPGREVRLKGAYIVKCQDFKKDANGNLSEIYCTYDPDSKSGGSGANRKVKGTLHWVSVAHAIDAEIRLYDRLFSDEDPDGHNEKDFKDFINPDSLKIVSNCKLETSLQNVKAEDKFQFQRLGYFCVDKDSTSEHLVFNRTVPLRDSWARKK